MGSPQIWGATGRAVIVSNGEAKLDPTHLGLVPFEGSTGTTAAFLEESRTGLNLPSRRAKLAVRLGMVNASAFPTNAFQLTSVLLAGKPPQEQALCS